MYNAELRVEKIEFIRNHGKFITNILVVLLVVMAVYTKLQENGMDALFKLTDLYILAGGLLGLLVVRFLSKRKK
ncbi:hypothetical protein SAMN05216582_11635 [Selenomonas ruminantium]|uniref:Uncharacterized protein n=1 Tax=Selenomonas ruminantium TaxID=971 RepID=A0A1M6V3M7_SELRU|nr:hypothetical protein SAMN05216582_11635 [Selenomonas ruminantium]